MKYLETPCLARWDLRRVPTCALSAAPSAAACPAGERARCSCKRLTWPAPSPRAVSTLFLTMWTSETTSCTETWRHILVRLQPPSPRTGLARRYMRREVLRCAAPVESLIVAGFTRLTCRASGQHQVDCPNSSLSTALGSAVHAATPFLPACHQHRPQVSLLTQGTTLGAAPVALHVAPFFRWCSYTLWALGLRTTWHRERERVHYCSRSSSLCSGAGGQGGGERGWARGALHGGGYSTRRGRAPAPGAPAPLRGGRAPRGGAAWPVNGGAA